MASAAFLASALFVAAGFLALGAWAGRRVRSAEDYGVAGRAATASGVSGVLLGALVGGASTVGTAQMAYEHGLSACWFTVGGGLGCLVLGLWLAGPLRRSGMETLPGLLEARFGRPTALVAVAATSLGTFVSLVAQFLSAAALLRAVLPLAPAAAGAAVAALVVGFAALGGVRSFAALGQAKIALLYVALAACGVAALAQGATPERLWRALPHETFFDPLSLGWADGSAIASLVVGVLCTQIYAQAVCSARDERTARRGALLSAALMPPLGVLGIWVGLALRASGVALAPAEALPTFLRQSFPAPVAGALWSVILLTVVGTAAGLVLGIATTLSRDLLARRSASPWPGRLTYLALAVMAAALSFSGRDIPILRWSYAAMGLRGAGTFFPLVLALVRPGWLPARAALAASLGGVAVTLAWPLLGAGGEPLFAGLAASGLLAAAGGLGRRASPTPGGA